MLSSEQSVPEVDRSLTRKLEWWGGFVLIFAYALWILAPWSCSYIRADHEASWQRGLQDAFLTKTPFGTDFVFSYGPWGFITQNIYHPALYGFTVGIQTVLTLWFFAWVWILAKRVWRDNPLMVCIVCACVVFMASVHFDVFFVVLLSFIVIDHFFPEFDGENRQSDAPGVSLASRIESKWMRLGRQGLILSSAFIGLTKFTSFVLAVAFVTTIALDELLRKKRIPWIVAIFAAETLFFWMLAGQPVKTFLPFVSNALEFAGGYSALAREAPPADLLAVLALAALFWVPLMWSEWRRRGKWSLIPLAGFSFLTLLIVKHCLIRFDAGHARTVVALSALSLLILPLSWRPQARLVHPLFVILAASLLVPKCILYRQNLLGLDRKQASHDSEAFSPPGSKPASRGELHEAAVAAICRDYPLPVAEGTFDAYPGAIAVPAAQGVKCQPRPVISSYSASTPRLARLNADHLCGPRAPDRVLFDIVSMDDHFPTQEDGLSWPELLTRYEVESVLPPGRDLRFLLLKHSAQPRRYELTPLQQATIGFGSHLELPGPEEGPIWVEISVRPTVAGKIFAAAYEPPLIWMETALRDGQKVRYRLVTSVAKAGFLLSPIVEDSTWFRWLATTPWHDPAWQRLLTGKGVESVQLLPPDRKWCYDPQISVRLFRLTFPACGPASMAFRPGLVGLVELAAGDSREDPKTRWENVPGGAALTIRRGTTLLIPVSEKNRFLPLVGPACRLRIAFGLLCTGPAETPPGHPSRFRIDTIDSKGWRKTIWAASLDIARHSADSGIRTAEIPVSLTGVQSLCFQSDGPEAGDDFVPAWFGISCF
ncbi:MAG: hypothetical protein ABSG68_07205 [Thermoguttaceae bacterium]|jgi:hypothetical protein